MKEDAEALDEAGWSNAMRMLPNKATRQPTQRREPSDSPARVARRGVSRAVA